MADASIALNDPKGELTHLRSAANIDPKNLKLNKRLASRLLDGTNSENIGEFRKQIESLLEQIKDRKEDDAELEVLKERLRKKLE